MKPETALNARGRARRSFLRPPSPKNGSPLPRDPWWRSVDFNRSAPINSLCQNVLCGSYRLAIKYLKDTNSVAFGYLQCIGKLPKHYLYGSYLVSEDRDT